ncbi:MAG: glycosyltransferase [bacterium]
MKICLVNTFHYRRGGDSTYTLDLSDLLESKGHQVIHFAMKHPQNLPSKWDKYFADHIDFSVIFRNGNIAERTRAFLRSLYSFEARRRFAKLLDDTQPEIIHLQNFRRHLTFSLLEEAKKREIPVVLTAHDYDPICPNSLLLANGKVCEACKNFKYYKAIFRRCKEKSILWTAAITMECYFVSIRCY